MSTTETTTEVTLNKTQEVTVMDTGNPDPNKIVGGIGVPITKRKFTGRKPLEVPYTSDMLNEHVIKECLPSIFEKLSSNIADYEHLYNVYAGNSNIQQKQRETNKDKDNNIVDERHPFYMVEWKKGYLYGKDTKYSCADADDCTDELTVLSKFMKSQKKARKNMDIVRDVYIAGAGNRIVLTKNQIKDDECPFEIFNLDYRKSFIVYSSTYTNELLFGGIITELPNSKEQTCYEVKVYDKNYVYTFYTNSFYMNVTEPIYACKKRHYMGCVPFVEWKTNNARIGLIEVVESILDAANTITSNEVDNIVDYVNSILVIYNQSIDKATIDGVLQNRAMELKTIDPTRPAEAKYLVNALEHGDVMQKYESLVKVAYNIAGVPLPTTQNTSGGDTGEARNLGGGWASASIVADNEEIMLKEAEMDMLRICLNICLNSPKTTKITSLSVEDIEINFSRNRNDNLLVKTQSLQNLHAMGVPKEISLNYVGISANSHEDAQAWELEENKRMQQIEVVQKKQAIEEPSGDE